ncbi:MAG: alpha-galactosidase [Lachnospiraceae bacterium]|nr:alpha-galactosidase [Lachnospiraceae bacterium]
MRYEINCQKSEQITGERAEDIQFRECLQEDCLLGSIKINIKNEAFRENKNLRMEHPVRLWIPVKKPQRMTAFYLYNEWWTRPSFIREFGQIPEKTQVLLMEYEETYRCMIPVVGEQFKTYLMPGTKEELCFELTSGIGGQNRIEEPVYLIAEGKTVYEAIRKAFLWLERDKGIRPREERRIPEMFHYLGWCSWNAFYRDMNENAIIKKAEEFRNKKIPVKWMLIDDGWLSVEEDNLCEYIPDRDKFPNGFSAMVGRLKKEADIQWVGVWHALAGFWNGIQKNSDLYKNEKEYLYETRSHKILPNPMNGSGFYADWYEELFRQGIRFVKVDGQSSTACYFENDIDLTTAARGLSLALEQGASRMDGAVINCMGMAMENILARPTMALSRNSDDFMPEKEDGFTEHLLQNAYNSLYHNEIYCCDWDMFWSRHEDAQKHSVLRAISGGPIYVSDKIGESDPEILKSLTYFDGKILMLERSAKPSEDCIFADPRQNGVLKLHNYGISAGRKAGVIAVYNLTRQSQIFEVSAQLVPELCKEKDYWLYDYQAKKATLLKAGTEYRDKIEASDYALYWVLPVETQVEVLGLINKYAGFQAVEYQKGCAKRLMAVIHESGTIGWIMETPLHQVLVNGEDCTDQVEVYENLCILNLEEGQKEVCLIIS